MTRVGQGGRDFQLIDSVGNGVHHVVRMAVVRMGRLDRHVHGAVAGIIPEQQVVGGGGCRGRRQHGGRGAGDAAAVPAGCCAAGADGVAGKVRAVAQAMALLLLLLLEQLHLLLLANAGRHGIDTRALGLGGSTLQSGLGRGPWRVVGRGAGCRRGGPLGIRVQIARRMI